MKIKYYDQIDIIDVTTLFSFNIIIIIQHYIITDFSMSKLYYYNYIFC